MYSEERVKLALAIFFVQSRTITGDWFGITMALDILKNASLAMGSDRLNELASSLLADYKQKTCDCAIKKVSFLCKTDAEGATSFEFKLFLASGGVLNYN